MSHYSTTQELKSDTDNEDLVTDSAEKTHGPQIRPWVRFWARMIDYGIFGLLAGVVLGFAYPTILDCSSINLTLLLLTAYIFFESIMLASCGSTPGKALLRIKIRQNDGTKINYSNAFIRSVRVWWRGEGLGIPFISLITNILAYKSLKKNGRTAWDREGKLIVLHRPIGLWRIFATVILLTGLYLYGAIQFCLPFFFGNSIVKVLYIRNAAAHGNANAQLELGTCYAKGYMTEIIQEKRYHKPAVLPWSLPIQNNLWSCYPGVAQDPAETAKWFKKAAEQGLAEAQCKLANCYARGYGMAEDKTEAREWWRKAAEQGLAEAQYSLGHSYCYGKGECSNWNEMIKWLRKAAEQGHVEAQRYLAWAYASSNNKAKDETKAAEWWRKAAEQGNAEAQYQLGRCYAYAWGVERNETEAAKWYRLAVKNGSQSAQTELRELNRYIDSRKAAETGDAKALYDLGRCYDCGSGIEFDYGEALKLYRKAAELGYAEAQYELGKYYNGHSDLTEDKTEALKWWHKAAAQGHENAKKEIEKIDTYAQSLKSAEQGDAKAQFKLALCYEYGYGVKKNFDEAMKCFCKAAEQGNAEAQYKLGWCYGEGAGMAKDKTVAVKWYRKSAEQGYTEAQYQLANYYSRGYGVEQDKAEAVKWWHKAAESKSADSIDELQKTFRYYHEGRVNSQYELARCYASGDGVAKDETEAAKWQLRADAYTKMKKNTQ